MRHFLRKFPISDRKWFVRAVAAASSAFAYSYIESNYRVTGSLSLPKPTSTANMVSALWRMQLFPCGQLASEGNHPTHVYSVAPGQGADISSRASTVEQRHCHCVCGVAIANAIAKVGPAVVNLSAPQGFHELTMGNIMGSGTIIDPDGIILTCAHVVVDFQGIRASSKGKVEVTLQDGRTFEGTVLHVDLHYDIAIVKIKSRLPLPAAKLGSSSKLRPGHWVISMGLRQSLRNKITNGIISCVDRKSSDLGLGGVRREYLQTDCAIYEENSGGPLVNMDGEVVGVNNTNVLAGDGLNFAVPIDSITKIIEHSKKDGRVIGPWLGLNMIDLNEMIIAELEDKDCTFHNVESGVLVRMVTPGSPADHAGFKPGDVVINFDGKAVRNIKEIMEIMGDKIGTPLKIVVKRANDVVVYLTVMPEGANSDM